MKQCHYNQINLSNRTGKFNFYNLLEKETVPNVEQHAERFNTKPWTKPTTGLHTDRKNASEINIAYTQSLQIDHIVEELPIKR